MNAILPPCFSRLALQIVVLAFLLAAVVGQAPSVLASRTTQGAQIFSVSPNEAPRGETLNVDLSGSGFVPGTAVSFGQGINVNSAQVSSIALDHILTVNITIDPSATLGLRDVSVTNPGDKPVVEVDAFEVLGSAPGKLVVAPKKVRFPKTRVGKFKSKKLKIQNTGKGQLNGTITPPAEDSGFVMNPQQTQYSLEPDETLVLNVEFHPASKGRKKAEIVVTSDDPENPSVVVPLSGKGK